MMLGPFGKGIRKVPFSLVLSQILKDVATISFSGQDLINSSTVGTIESVMKDFLLGTLVILYTQSVL